MPAAYRFEAADGFSISLSANSGAYCRPREELWELDNLNYEVRWTDRNNPPTLEHSITTESELLDYNRQMYGPYTSVELGFPSGPVPQLTAYKDGDDPDKDSIYPYVPVQEFLNLMTDHGGIIQAHWSYLPPMVAVPDFVENPSSETAEVTFSHIVKALDPSVWAGWETLNWKSIPATFYFHGVTSGVSY